MKKIYILFTETNSVLSKSIRFYTKTVYNHTSISFSADLIDVFSFGRKKPRNPFLGGFVKENLSAGIFRQANCLIYSLTVTDQEWDKMYTYVEKMHAQKEIYTYNLVGLVGVARQLPIERKHAFFCSQFVATVLSENDLITFEKPLALITPIDLKNCLDLEFIYVGKLKNYLKAYTPRSITMQSYKKR